MMVDIFRSDAPADIEWRRNQMIANNRIEDLERDTEYAAFMDDLHARGVSVEESVRLLREFASKRAIAARIVAAE